MSNTLTLTIKGDSRTAVDAVKNVTRAMGEMVGVTVRSAAAVEAANRRTGLSFQHLARDADLLHGVGLKLAGVLAVVAGGAGLVARAGVDMNETVTRAERSLTHLSGSAEAATKFVGDLREVARLTAPTFKELLPIGQQLATAYGKEGLGQVLPTIIAFGDAAKIAGANTEQMKLSLLGFRQLIRSPRGVQIEELKQISENIPGLDPYKYLEAAFGTSDAEVLRKAGVTGRRAAAAILAGMQAEFGGAQAKGADDLEVVFSGLQDQLQEVGGELTREFTPALKDALGTLSSGVRDLAKDKATIAALREPFTALGEGIKSAAKGAADLIRTFRDLTPEEKKAVIETGALAVKYTAVVTALSLAVGWGGKLIAVLTRLKGLAPFAIGTTIGSAIADRLPAPPDTRDLYNNPNSQLILPPHLRNDNPEAQRWLREEAERRRGTDFGGELMLRDRTGRRLGLPPILPGLADLPGFDKVPFAGSRGQPSSGKAGDKNFTGPVLSPEDAAARRRVQEVLAEDARKEAEKKRRQQQDAANLLRELSTQAMPEQSIEQQRLKDIAQAQQQAEADRQRVKEAAFAKEADRAKAFAAIERGLQVQIVKANKDAQEKIAALKEEARRKAEARDRLTQEESQKLLQANIRSVDLTSLDVRQRGLEQGRSPEEIARMVEIQRAKELTALERSLGPELRPDEQMSLRSDALNAREAVRARQIADRQKELDLLRDALEAGQQLAEEQAEDQRNHEQMLERRVQLERQIKDLQAENASTAAESQRDHRKILVDIDGRVSALRQEKAGLSSLNEDRLKAEKIEGQILELLQRRKHVTDGIAEAYKRITEAGARSMARGLEEAGLGVDADDALRSIEEEIRRAGLSDSEQRRLTIRDQFTRKLHGDTLFGDLAPELQREISGLVDQMMDAAESKRSRWQSFWREMGQDLVGSLKGATAGLFENLFMGEKDAFKRFGEDLKRVLARSMSEILVEQISGAARGMFGGGRSRSTAGRTGGSAQGVGQIAVDFMGPPGPGQERAGIPGTGKIVQSVPQIAMAMAGIVQVFTQGKSKLANVITSIIQVLGAIPTGGGGNLLGGIIGGIGSLFGFDSAPQDSKARRWGFDFGTAWSQGAGDAMRGRGGAGPSLVVNQYNNGPVYNKADQDRSNSELTAAVWRTLRTA